MRVLVTGGSGMLGRHLKEFLPEATYISSKDYNLCNSFAVQAMFNDIEPECVIHLAAKVGGIQDNIANPLAFLEDNLVMNTNVVKYANDKGVKRFIGILSTCIYPDRLADDQYPMTEDLLHAGPPTPTNFGYGYAKRMLGVHLDTIRNSTGKDYFSIIPSNLYSEYDHFEDDTKMHFVTALLKKIKNSTNGIVPLFGTGTPLRQFIHAEDLAKIIAMCALSEEDTKTNFNVCCDDSPSIKEIAKAGLKATDKYRNKVLELQFDSSKPDGQYRKDCDNSKMRKLFPNFKFLSLEDGLQRVYNKL
jgi:GDP-L-fucose synthase